MLFGIFNIEKIENTTEYKNIYNELSSKNKIDDISCNIKNSFILTQNNNDIKGYISNIGTNTIKKRKIV